MALYISTLFVLHAILVLGMLPCYTFGGRSSTTGANIGGDSVSSSDSSNIPVIHVLSSRLEVVPYRVDPRSSPPSPARNVPIHFKSPPPTPRRPPPPPSSSQAPPP
ncbi:hypothetical protein FNV43_RR02774 [Rhamnella rubrinervis]|uniref:Transmembrane protein n=1 Tax=Rhamnella rubrinervis TaxID=2594499 RepID=A0A8K0HGI7_9ROSA|nr:hypothetical protein FNV43_RR02774 [Rhamnella rubrinervis]